MTVRDAIPRSWLDCMTAGPIGVGLDIATTDGPTSNPASITVTQDEGTLFERLVLSWKTRDEAVATAMLMTVMLDLATLPRWNVKGLSIDASNETFFAQGLVKAIRSALARVGKSCKFHLIKGGENLTFQGQTLNAKEMLGSLYVNAHTDGILATPEAAFLKEDRRLVQRSKGAFVTLTGKGGKHGDTFDSGKHARWALLSSGPAQAIAVPLTDLTLSHRRAWSDTSFEDDRGAQFQSHAC
jgi:hypothetical protein